MPHLLTYRWEESKRCHIAVGFRESGEAWTDIFFPEQEIADSDESDYRDIRKSYLDSGTWRTNQASASAASELKLDSLSGEYLLTATIQDTQNTTLQLGSHSLLLEVKRVPPGRGSSRESYRLPFTDFIPLTPITEEDDED
ncbi:hypothetical protein VKT23_014462 [Stygiomarasmius scandens]|uniref:Uncharacterized protein n=1 Tax=Marasmiellus scandens TaxID=2682957 RepID=A0ABR1J067_9AGAR